VDSHVHEQDSLPPTHPKLKCIQQVNLLRSAQSKQNANSSVVSTCVSPSGVTFGVVTPRNVFVHSLSGLKQPNPRPQCVFRIDDDGTLLSGLDSTQLKSSHHIGYEKKMWKFGCAATSDNVIAIAAVGKECLVLFSVKEGDHSLGKLIRKLSHPEGVVRKMLFSADCEELAVLICLPTKKEKWSFFSIANLSANPSEVLLDMAYPVSTRTGTIRYTYTTRDAKFSPSGSKLVSCTGHSYGSALVFMLAKDVKNTWGLLGRRQIVIRDLDNWDENCLGFTGLSLYCIFLRL
jgi:hypothetical protein